MRDEINLEKSKTTSIFPVKIMIKTEIKNKEN
jgi:hypothetical protein